jgi:autotransporter family porin
VESHGIWANSATGSVRVAATNVSAPGQYSTGIKATGGTEVHGGHSSRRCGHGWLAAGRGQRRNDAWPACRRVVLGSTGGVATLRNAGSIGALSDRAVAAIDLYRTGPAADPNIVNNGDLTGFVTLGGGTNSVVNNGSFNMRHFADTGGDGVRDTQRIAITNLGSGLANGFTNTGTLALSPVSGAATLETAGQYLPLGNPNNSMAPAGPVQGHIVGASAFTHGGVIDLQANPAAGDVLVITGAQTAGTVGKGTFVSNGGALKIDATLNEGDAASRADVLVVDGTSVGAGGATRVQVRNAGGAGAFTATGNGIGVVEVLDKSCSAAGAFALNGPVVAGAYEYRLFQGGVGAPAVGNWYLRSELIPPAPEPSPPLAPTPAPPSAPEPAPSPSPRCPRNEPWRL